MSRVLHELFLYAIFLCWVIFAVAIITRKRTKKASQVKRHSHAVVGMILEAISYMLVWWFRRPSSSYPVVGPLLEAILGIIAIIIAVWSIWITLAAVKTLGEHWSLAARIIDGHKLITTGPYKIVRNPIYTGMLGMLIATGLALSTWIILLVATGIFMWGTAIRVRSEEKVLREHFGAEFDAYTKAVPAYIPKFTIHHSGHSDETH